MSRDVLELLRAAGGYISGEKMAERLGVTRAAVWKKIVALREAGYDISSAPRSGYVLRSAPDRLHTIVPGMLIAHTLGDTFAAEDILYSDSGVREGYIWKEIIGVEE